MKRQPLMLVTTIWVISGLSWTLTATAGQAAPVPTPTDDPRLVEAVQRQDLEAVESLLVEHANVDAPQADGATPLAWAAHWDALPIADLLIRAGANVNAPNDLGVTPLMLASSNGSAPMVDKLLQARADPTVARPTGETALMMASRSGTVAVVRLLIAQGADVNAATTRGHTALMMLYASWLSSVRTFMRALRSKRDRGDLPDMSAKNQRCLAGSRRSIPPRCQETGIGTHRDQRAASHHCFTQS